MTAVSEKEGRRRVDVVIEHPSPNWDERTSPVSMIVLHFTALPTFEASLRRLCDPANQQGRVSAHYLIREDGAVLRLVNEEKRAWHAGAGSWRRITDVNSASVGIEIQNIGLDDQGRPEPFPDVQMESVIALCRDIQRRHVVPARNVVGHGDTAPRRKIDPGAAFDWKRLVKAGVGIWTDEFLTPEKSMKDMLQDIGYDISDVSAATEAFKRHWCAGTARLGANQVERRAAAVCAEIFKQASDGR